MQRAASMASSHVTARQYAYSNQVRLFNPAGAPNILVRSKHSRMQVKSALAALAPLLGACRRRPARRSQSYRLPSLLPPPPPLRPRPRPSLLSLPPPGPCCCCCGAGRWAPPSMGAAGNGSTSCLASCEVCAAALSLLLLLSLSSRTRFARSRAWVVLPAERQRESRGPLEYRAWKGSQAVRRAGGRAASHPSPARHGLPAALEGRSGRLHVRCTNCGGMPIGYLAQW